MSNKNKNNKQTLKKNLNNLIIKSGKTRKEICTETGIGYSTFTEWANGRSYPRIDKIELLARYFGCDKSDLIEESQPSHTRISPQEVGSIIRRRREELNLSTAELSARVGMAETELASWENGTTADKSIRLAKKLSDVLGIPFGTIIGAKPSARYMYERNFFQRLKEAFINIIFTDAEIEQLIAYGKFLESQREK